MNILDRTYDQIRSAVAELGQSGFRADQLCDWVFKKGVADKARMTNLPKSLLDQVEILDSTVAARADSADGTIKLLLEMYDGQRVESVLIPADGRATACVSTQVGCGMGCTFCASGEGGVVRNLSGGEILQQVLHLSQAGGQRITHVVFMGIGEPLANYDATIFAVRALVDPKRFGLSARHITVSTVGIPKAMRRLADEDLPISLAISLHAPNDALRRKIMPAAASATIDDIVEAGKYFFESRGRELTLEYILISDLNDTNVCAEALANVAHSLRCNVNLIRYNEVEGLRYKAPSPAAVSGFAQRLKRFGVNVQIRRSRGEDVTAACGQLRRSEQPLEEPASQEPNDSAE